MTAAVLRGNGGGPGRALQAALTSAAPLLILLALWQVASISHFFPPQIMVPPADVLRTLFQMAQSGELERHVGDSLFRLAIGFVIGATAGLLFGVAISLSRLAEAAFSPLFMTLWQVPVIAVVPLLVMYLGIGESFKVATVAIAAFFPVAIATFDGIRSVPKAWFDVGRVYRLRLVDMIGRILIPATVPAVVTGLRIGLTRAWVVLVATELLAADSGIGQMMEMGRQLFQIDVVLAGVIVSGVIGFLIDRGARAIESRATRWRTA